MSNFHVPKDVGEIWSFPSLESIELTETQSVVEDVPGKHESTADNQLQECMEELNHRINYVDAIALQLKDILTEIDATLLNSLINLIKNTVKKIILKELSIDKTLLRDMVKRSLEDIKKDNESCVIYVCPYDFSIFENHQFANDVTVQADLMLNKGDFIIKTKLTEVEAILQQRLDVLFGL